MITIEINMDRKCVQCGHPGAGASGLCITCASKKVCAELKTKHAAERERENGAGMNPASRESASPWRKEKT